MSDKLPTNASMEPLVRQVASKLNAEARSEDGAYHLEIPVLLDDEEEVTVTVTLTLSDDRDTIFITRYLCEHSEAIDLEELLFEVNGTSFVQLGLDEEQDLMLSGAAPVNASADWIAQVVEEIASFAPELAEEDEDDEDDE